jgi:hypothetical protein
MRILVLGLLSVAVCAAQQGLLQTAAGHRAYPIGMYELPKTDAGLQSLAAAGFNLVHCDNRADLDRVAKAGMMGWISLPMQLGDDPAGALRKAVDAVKDHPALAVLEGPDEITWGFTAASELFRNGSYKQPNEWWLQTKLAREHAGREGAKILGKLREGTALVRKLDGGRHPLWINEAARSDMKFIRDYVDGIDITGCDIYPVNGLDHEPIGVVADYTRRFASIGRGRPVWMVLQGFDWSVLPEYGARQPVYPSFEQTRLMAYASIANGARGILYWGTYLLQPAQAAFRSSLYAMASELASLQPFLTAPEQETVKAVLTESNGHAAPDERGVRWICRRSGDDWLIAVVNEDGHAHMGVELTGLNALNGRPIVLLYGNETPTVEHGGFVTRLRPYEVKVFATSRNWETRNAVGRDFGM